MGERSQCTLFAPRRPSKTHVASLGGSGSELSLLLVKLALGSGNVVLDEPGVSHLEGQQAFELGDLLLPIGNEPLVLGEVGRGTFLFALAL
jgi:hypothetical protein